MGLVSDYSLWVWVDFKMNRFGFTLCCKAFMYSLSSTLSYFFPRNKLHFLCFYVVLYKISLVCGFLRKFLTKEKRRYEKRTMVNIPIHEIFAKKLELKPVLVTFAAKYNGIGEFPVNYYHPPLPP